MIDLGSSQRPSTKAAGQPTIVFMNAWFGKWPAWMPLYLASAGANSTIDFVIISDAPPPAHLPDNVRIIATSFDDYRRHIAEKLRIIPKWDSPYKLCDLKPALAYLHPDVVGGYDFWAFGDIDVIYGNLRNFLTDADYDHDIISSHQHIIGGHLTFVRNIERMNRAFQRPLHWRWLLANAKHKSFDERIMTMMFARQKQDAGHWLHRLLVPKMSGGHLVERYSTPLPGLPWVDGSQNFPAQWFWKDGRLTTSNSADQDFMYLHFTHWASKRWTNGKSAVWDRLERVNRVSNPDPAAFSISAAGFEEIVA